MTAVELTPWLTTGVQTLGDVYQEGLLLPDHSLLAAIRGKWGDMSAEQPTHLTIQHLHVMGRDRHLTRWFAESLHLHTAISMTPVRQRLEGDRGTLLQIRSGQRSSLIYIPRNSRFRLIQHYVLQRAYLNSAKN